MSYYSTKEVARILGINTSRLARAAWDERFLPPQKGPSGNFLWTDADIERASWALRKRGIQPGRKCSGNGNPLATALQRPSVTTRTGFGVVQKRRR